MTGLLELAERVEASTGPDRELDAAISAVVYPPNTPGLTPAFTASLDAAMTLVPEEWHTELALQDRHSLRWKWTLRGGFGVRAYALSETPALALCAAALRASATPSESSPT